MKKIAKLLTLALGVFMLASCEDVPSPYGTVTPPEEPTKVLPTGDGTKDNPYNVAGAIEKCQEIGGEMNLFCQIILVIKKTQTPKSSD